MKGISYCIKLKRQHIKICELLLWPPDLKKLTHWKRPWWWRRLKAGGEGDNRGWDGWVASPTQWTWVWASSGSWWWTRKPVCCSPWGCKETDMTERLNWTKSVLTRKFISLIASIGKERNFQINDDVSFYLNKPEKRQIKPPKCKVKEIIKINIEVNEIKTKAIEKSMKPKTGSLEISIKF